MFRAMSDSGRYNITARQRKTLVQMCRLSVQSLDRCTSGQCCLTKQRDERFVSIQVLCHRLLKHDVLKDVAVDGGKSSLREMHSHHFRILVPNTRCEQVNRIKKQSEDFPPMHISVYSLKWFKFMKVVL